MMTSDENPVSTGSLLRWNTSRSASPALNSVAEIKNRT